MQKFIEIVKPLQIILLRLTDKTDVLYVRIIQSQTKIKELMYKLIDTKMSRSDN